MDHCIMQMKFEHSLTTNGKILYLEYHDQIDLD